MAAVFDPYQAWLGIPRHEQPPHHYRLLGIAPLETDPAVIEAAAERQTKILQMQAVGPYVGLAQQFCGEVAAARYCLLNPAAKDAYDTQLRLRLAQAAAAPPNSPPVVASARPLPMAAPPATAAPPAPIRPIPAPSSNPPPRLATSAAPPINVSGTTQPAQRNSVSRSRRPNSSGRATAGRSALELAKIIIGGIAGLAIAVLILNYFVGIDLLGWSVKSRKEDSAPKKVAAAKVSVATQKGGSDRPTPPAELRDPVVPNPVGPVESDHVPPPVPLSGFNSQPAKGSPSPPPEEAPPAEEPRSLADLTQNGKTNSSTHVKKAPPPSDAEQASKLAAIKDIYKTEFSAARPGGNPEFMGFLLSTAAKVEGDPVARYVLYLEAFKQACTASEFDAAAEALDKLEAEFEGERFSPRFELLTKMASNAKANDERLIVAKAALHLLDHAMALGKIEEADKLARFADTQTKIIIDKELRTKAAAALQMTSILSKDLKSVADAQVKLAQFPDDPAANLAVGRYHCLIEGNWAGGLPHLTKCDDDAIKSAAVLDLAGPSGEVTAGKIGDAWYDLAKGGKGQSFYGRADYWYQQGMEVESGLALVRLKKRHEEIGELKLPTQALGRAEEQLVWRSARDLVSGGGAGDLPSTDLLTLINLQRASPLQGWGKNGNSLTSPTAAQNTVAFVETTFQPPRREYSLQARVTRSVDLDTKGRPAGGVIFGLTQKGKRFALVIDELAPSGQRLAYLTMGSAKESQNSSVVRYPQIRLRSDDVVCNVASDKISVLVGGTPLLQYTGDMSALALPPGSPFAPAKPFFYAQEFGINVINRWSVGPLAVQSAPAKVK